jgi:5-methyltetrahydrofolate--homocysteine methyltransferase
MTRAAYMTNLATQRVLILDGAMGTMIQRLGLTEDDYSLEGLVDADSPLQAAPGCNELLSITRADVIYDIHRAYIGAGADIIETNTFGANRFSLEEYGLANHVYDINLAAVEVARCAVEEAEHEDESRYVFIAGVIGPTGKSASFSPSVDDPSLRDATFADFCDVYREQITALLDARVDALLIETVFDTLAAKAALTAATQLFKEREESVPLMVSATFSDGSRRTLSGQTLEAFLVSLSSFPIFSLGVNCSVGAAQMIPLIRELAQISPFLTSAHPNAGFPDQEGEYRQTPVEFASLIAPVLEEGCLSIVGGCCGTTPEHIKALSSIAGSARLHEIPIREPEFCLSGLEALVVPLKHQFITIGERANVAGSRKFSRLIKQGLYDQALSVARSQIEQGAQIIDICMDDAMIDASKEMVRFIRLSAADPTISRVPFMIDSSSWQVLHAALPELQGRGIVNSISLKEGEEDFLAKARYIASMGAAVVVMLFDEEGQADTFERKCAVAERSYRILVDSDVFRPESIVFDPNILSIATGIDEHDAYARDFILATKWIKQRFPLVKISGGLSNLSFSFRGNNALREAIHAIFLSLAVEAGLDMAIVNPAMEFVADDVPEPAASIIREALLLEKSDGVTARNALIDLALSHSLDSLVSSSVGKTEATDLWRTLPVKERLSEALIRGDDTFLEIDLQEAANENAVSLIEGPLMGGMSKVGDLFGQGKLFLPQVVRSARIMKKAVDILQPRLELSAESVTRSAGTIVLATVKGDVHDIGKNIVSLVLRCNNFKVVDLGVMVPSDTILQTAIDEHADMIALSGLITPSLVEMANVCRLCEKRGLTIPILIGGATTSEEHTARKLFPLYPYGVVHTSDASQTVAVALQLASVQKDLFLANIAEKYSAYSGRTEEKKETVFTMKAARALKFRKSKPAPRPVSYGVRVFSEFPFDSLISSINWRMFASAWRVSPNSEEAKRLEADAKALLTNPEIQQVMKSSFTATIGIFPAYSQNEDIILFDSNGIDSLETLHFLRMQKALEGKNCYSLADFVMEGSGSPTDSIGLFVASAGIGVADLSERIKANGNEYDALLVTMLADRLAESLIGYLHNQLAFDWWAYGDVPSIRPAPGYASDPDHASKKKIFTLLNATANTGVVLTESFAMQPAASVCGYLFVGEGARYFSLGSLGKDQLSDYALRTGRKEELLEHAMMYDTSDIEDSVRLGN